LFREKLPTLILVAAIAGLGYLLLASLTDLTSVGSGIRRVGWAATALVLLLSLLNYGLRYWRWRAFLRALGHDIPERTHVAAYIAGFAFTPTPGKAGEAVRSLYLLPHGVSATESVGVLLVERALDFWAVCVLAILLFTSWQVAILAVAVSAFLAAILGLRGIRTQLLRMARFTASVLPRRVLDKVASFGRMRQVSASLVRPRLLLIGMGVGLVAWFAEGVGLYVLVLALGNSLDLALAVGIYGWSVLLGAISFLPGGLGSTEAAMGFFLKLHGLSLDDAIVATLLCRLATLWFAVVLGVVAALWLSRRQRASAKVIAS